MMAAFDPDRTWLTIWDSLWKKGLEDKNNHELGCYWSDWRDSWRDAGVYLAGLPGCANPAQYKSDG